MVDPVVGGLKDCSMRTFITNRTGKEIDSREREAQGKLDLSHLPFTQQLPTCESLGSADAGSARTPPKAAWLPLP